MKCKPTTKQNELAEAKGGRSEVRCWGVHDGSV